MIPTYQELMTPVLERAREGEVKFRDAVDDISNELKLTDEELSELLPSGKQTVIANRIGWAKTYLSKAGLLNTKKRGFFTITDRGIEALNSGQNIDNKYLKQFDTFNSFHGQSSEIKVVDNTLTQDDEQMTPDEVLRRAYEKINDSLSTDLLTRVRAVSPIFFETLLVDLLVEMGYGGNEEGAAHALGRTGDNGVDGVINQDPLGVDQIYIQAKRYAGGNNVGASDIRDFFGALNLKKANKGLFITTSDFTQSAVQTARDLGSRIVLINGQQLSKLMLRFNVGCRDVETLHLKRVDEDFFDN
ncbi:restriction endonuclease [Alteromonas macleodii]|uniref:restriction endonuclease n=1 Tax=Alteromonas macleodii TaxID=28108 RepID=UPI00066A93E5|nr:restriction endonuclease [Alteromonas macleodii]CAI3962974.1 restriction system protein [Alteromonas macleodii]VTP53777.1 restriction system protein [Alteromonas macleodii]